MPNQFIEDKTETIVAEPQEVKKITKKKSKVAVAFRKFQLPSVFQSGNLMEAIPYLSFIVMLAIVYIGYSYRADKRVRAIDKVGKEIKIMRTDYIAGKSELMQASRASAVAVKVEHLGLSQAIVPPGKIVNDLKPSTN